MSIFRPLLINPRAAVCCAITALASVTYADLAGNEDYQNGMEALVNQLPEVAVKRLSVAALAKDLTDKERVKVLFRLCEAQVRARRGMDAEKTLQHPLLQEHSDRQFWLAQSLVAQGRRKAAAEEFEKVVASQNTVRHSLSLVALSELYRSLQQEDKAFAVLEKAAKLSKLSVAAKIQLAEAYYEKGNVIAARKAIEGIEPTRLAERNAMGYLLGKLSLAEGELEDAKKHFDSLLKSGRLKPGYAEMCKLGIGDVLVKQENSSEAVAMVSQMIDVDGGSNLLLLMFERLIGWSDQVEDLKVLNTQLEKWITRPKIILEDGSEKEAEIEFSDRDAFAHFLLAKNLSREKGKEALARSLALLNELRRMHPGHSLVSKSWFLTSQVLLQQGKLSEATGALTKLEQTGRTDKVKRKASLLIGLALADNDKAEEGIKAFRKLVDAESKAFGEEAKVNIALLQLKRGSLVAFANEIGNISDEEVRHGLLIEGGLDSLTKGRPGAREQLTELLKVTGEHALTIEVRFALAKHFLSVHPFEPEKAQQCIAQLKKVSLSDLQQTDLAELEMRSLIFNKRWEEVVKVYLEREKASVKVSDKMLINLGEAYYRNGEFNKARMSLNKVIKEYKDSEYLEYAHFYTAMAARREGTPQSRKEALELFQRVIDLDGVLAVEGVIQRVRLLIDEEQLEEAVTLMSAALNKTHSPQVAAHLKTLLAEVYHRKGVKDKNNVQLLAKAEKLYLEVLVTPGTRIAWKYQIYFLLGQTQEKVDPTLTKALDSYFKVINLELQKEKNQPVEWEWYYKCGLRAVSLLEQEERWEAAANLLDKMAGFFGPKSDMLRVRADKIRLEHHIF